MDQVWWGSRSENINTTATRYNTMFGGFGWFTNEVDAQMVCPSAGTIKTLKADFETAPGVPEQMTDAVAEMEVEGKGEADQQEQTNHRAE